MSDYEAGLARPPHGTGVTASLYAEYARSAVPDDVAAKLALVLRLALANGRFDRLGVPVHFGAPTTTK